jgi:hypothetical protein
MYSCRFLRDASAAFGHEEEDLKAGGRVEYMHGKGREGKGFKQATKKQGLVVE